MHLVKQQYLVSVLHVSKLYLTVKMNFIYFHEKNQNTQEQNTVEIK